MNTTGIGESLQESNEDFNWDTGVRVNGSKHGEFLDDLSNEELVKSLSDLESEVLVVLVVPVLDGSSYLLINISAVDDEVFSDVESKSLGSRKALDDFGEFSGKEDSLCDRCLTSGDSIRENLETLAE